VEDKTSGLEDKIDIKDKTKELLDKSLKNCKKNMQELSDSIKRPSVQIMGVEGEEVQAKRIHNNSTK
jgi:hypothetical protein